MKLKTFYKALFLDLDHTLCDTADADRKGEHFFGQMLFKEQIDGEMECSKAASLFMNALYHGHSNCERILDENETDYRSRLIQFAVSSQTHFKPDLKKSKYWLEAVMDHRIQSLSFFEGTVELLEKLSSNYKLIVITNGPLYSQKPKVDKLQITKWADHVLMCGAFPWQKPDPRIFQEALKRVNCSSEEVIHVGDSLKSDIQGAWNAGIDSVWISDKKSLNESDPVPNAIVESFVDLENLLRV